MYIYNATGVKLKKTVNVSITDYAGNYIYENDELQFFNHPEGYATPVNAADYDSGFYYVYQYKDHLGNIRLSYTDNNGNLEIVEENNYYPFGLKHKGYNNMVSSNGNSTAQKFKYNSVELEESLGLNLYEMDFRQYDPAIARFTSIDPLAERRHELTPYNFVQNSPMFRIDPDGLTDFTLNRNTGEVTQVGETNDEPDRILKTNRKGEVKTYKRGKKKGQAKVAIGGIEQGILSDGQNFKTDSNIISVGGEGQPTEQEVESFALKLSNYVGTEIGGAYFSKDGAESITHITIGGYKNNSFKETKSHGHNLRSFFNTKEEINSFSIRGFFHTHPGNGGNISNSDRLVPSDPDLDTRDNVLKINPTLKFFLLTHPVNCGDRYPKRIDYTKGYSRRLK